MMKPDLITTRIKPTVERPTGFVLLVTLIVLVVLASLTVGLSTQLSMAKRRQQYMIEYQRARYGLDSGMKYILTVLPKKTFALEDRQERPDFSDLFGMNREEYAEFIASWAETATDEQIQAVLKKGVFLSQLKPLKDEDVESMLTSLLGEGEASDANSIGRDPDSYDTGEDFYMVELDPNDVIVPGPYGIPWPNVIEPIELEIGPCKVTITIEDENAKMPLSWFVTSSKEANKRAENALKTFCEWMSWDQEQLRELESHIQDAMDKVYEKKTFKLNPGPILLKSTTTRAVQSPTTASRGSRSRSRTRTTSRTVRQITTQKRPAVGHTTDFAKLFHSSLLDQEFLARPLPDTGERVESPLKYLSLWGAQRVNVNTAPRHVLEATFALAMDRFDLPEFTQQVIERRKEKPFLELDELKDLGGLDSEAMKNINNYLTTVSTFFQIRVTSRSGSACSFAVATVVKEGNNVERLVILYE